MYQSSEDVLCQGFFTLLWDSLLSFFELLTFGNVCCLIYYQFCTCCQTLVDAHIKHISSASHLQQDLLWCCTEAELFCNRTLSDDFNTDNTVTFQFGHKHIRSMFPLSSFSLHSIKNTKSLFRLRSCFL